MAQEETTRTEEELAENETPQNPDEPTEPPTDGEIDDGCGGGDSPRAAIDDGCGGNP